MPGISAQLLSPVTATAFFIFANAKQARSANDKFIVEIADSDKRRSTISDNWT